MGHSKKLKIRFLSILKDKASLLRATFSTRRTRLSIVRAANPPSDHRVASVLAAGNGSRATAAACIKSLMDRLHGTSNAAVAMKTLFLLHNIVSKGSFILKDQLSIFPASGGHNFLNLSSFRDAAGPESWEMSSWVRWYTAVLEQNLAASRVLGYHFSSAAVSTKKSKSGVSEDRLGKILELMNWDLLREIEALVGLVEEISNTPDCLNMQKNNLVYEVVRLVGEDYRLCQVELWVRVVELGHRMESLSETELSESMGRLQRLEKCREGLRLLFVNRNRNYRMWDLVGDTNLKLGKMKEEAIGFAESTRAIRMTSAGGLFGVDRMQLALSSVG